MSDYETGLNNRERVHTGANLRLASRFMRELLEESPQTEPIPEGNVLILLPEDDPDLAAANLALAKRLSAEGRSVILRRVRPAGAAAPDRPEWQVAERRSLTVRNLTPRWAGPIDDDQIVIVYDAGRDVLWIDFFGGTPRPATLPLNDFTQLTIDLASGEAFGYLIPQFLSRAIRKVPRLAQILAAAELRPLRAEELGELASAGQDDLESQPRIETQGDLELLMQDLARLSA
jgi:hypothetical protein